LELLSLNLSVGIKENTKKIGQDMLSPGRDLNPESPEYEAGLLLTGRYI
jgi:hypothetical protein